MFRIGFAVIFQEEGLNKDHMRKELSNMANLVGESDGTIEDRDHNEVPIWAYLMDGTLSEYLKIKLEYNCEEYNYMLFPREAFETRSIFVES